MEKAFQESLDFIRKITDFKPKTGIILGTGLGQLVNELQSVARIDYATIPHFPTSTVETHSGKLHFGHLNGQAVVVMQGRFHAYEGYSMQEVTYPVRIMKLLGIEKLLISNVAGGIHPSFQLGDLMVINDHINLHGSNPLSGKNLDELGPRFPDMLAPYDEKLRAAALSHLSAQGIRHHEGVYVSVPGPNLETPAEYKFLGIIGADAVGMSTVPEVIVARHMELPTFAVSVITDLCYPGALKKISIEEIIQIANTAQPKLVSLFKHLA